MLLIAIVAVGYGLSRPESLKPIVVYLLERYTGRGALGENLWQIEGRIETLNSRVTLGAYNPPSAPFKFKGRFARPEGEVLRLLGGDFMRQLADTLNPFSQTERFTKLECAVLNAKVSSGVLTLNPGLVMRTDKVNMYMAGTADLGSEQLDLSLATQPRKGIGISAGSLVAPYFKVGGAFTQLQLQLDPQTPSLLPGRSPLPEDSRSLPEACGTGSAASKIPANPSGRLNKELPGKL